MTVYITRETLSHCASTVFEDARIPPKGSEGVLLLSAHQMTQYILAADINFLHKEHGSKNLGDTSEQVVQTVIPLVEKSIVDLGKDFSSERDSTQQEILSFQIDRKKRVLVALRLYLLDTLGIGLYAGPVFKRQRFFDRVQDFLRSL